MKWNGTWPYIYSCFTLRESTALKSWMSALDVIKMCAGYLGIFLLKDLSKGYVEGKGHN